MTTVEYTETETVRAPPSVYYEGWVWMVTTSITVDVQNILITTTTPVNPQPILRCGDDARPDAVELSA